MDKQNNDALRASIPQVSPPNRLLFTRGVIALGVEDVHEILMKVKNFDDFNESNDPYGEHDFGSFNHKGEYSVDYQFKSIGTRRVWRRIYQFSDDRTYCKYRRMLLEVQQKEPYVFEAIGRI